MIILSPENIELIIFNYFICSQLGCADPVQHESKLEHASIRVQRNVQLRITGSSKCQEITESVVRVE